MSMHWWALLGAGLLEVAWAAGFKFAFRNDHLVTGATLAARRMATPRGDARRIAHCVLPDGEQYKTLETVGRVFDALVGAISLAASAAETSAAATDVTGNSGGSVDFGLRHTAQAPPAIQLTNTKRPMPNSSAI